MEEKGEVMRFLVEDMSCSYCVVIIENVIVIVGGWVSFDLVIYMV